VPPHNLMEIDVWTDASQRRKQLMDEIADFVGVPKIQQKSYPKVGNRKIQQKSQPKVGNRKKSVLLQTASELEPHTRSETESQIRSSAPSVFVGYLSAPENGERRDQIRKNCFPSIKKLGVDVHFFIGRPSDPKAGHINRVQASLPTKWETDMAEQLKVEHAKHKDLHILPVRDVYRDLTDKSALLFMHALTTQADLIMKIDDDMCPNMTRVLGEVATGAVRYVGFKQLNGTEYESQAGVAGLITPYMPGPCYALSRELAKRIYLEDANDNFLFATFGRNSEDTNTGRFVSLAETRDPSFKIERRTVPYLCSCVEAKDCKHFTWRR